MTKRQAGLVSYKHIDPKYADAFNRGACAPHRLATHQEGRLVQS